jgi:membrane protein YqaA with SNARE-associated domain
MITLGMTTADMITYFLARWGSTVGKQIWGEKLFAKLVRIRERSSWGPTILLLIFASIAPLPNETLLIPMALGGYRFWRIFPPVLIGNFIFNMLYAMGVLAVFGFL